MSRKNILQDISNEVDRSLKYYPHFHSNHEGYAVIKEELDELWDLIKESKFVLADAHMRFEAVQVAAMAVKFIEGLYECVDK